jgi:hypothetical protein
MAGFFTIGVTLSKILSQFLNKEPLEFWAGVGLACFISLVVFSPKIFYIFVANFKS